MGQTIEDLKRAAASKRGPLDWLNEAAASIGLANRNYIPDRNPITEKVEGSNIFEKVVGISDEEKALQGELVRQKELKGTEEYKALIREGITPQLTTATKPEDLSYQLKQHQTTKNLKSQLAQLGEFGIAERAKLGDNPTDDQLRSAYVIAQQAKTEADPLYQAKLKAANQNIKESESAIRRGEAANLLAESTLQFQRDSKKEDQDWRRSESERAERRHQLQLQEGRIEREMIRAENAERRATDLKIRMAELDSYNTNQQADREYKHKLMKQQKTQNLVEALVGLSASFAL